MKVLTIWQPQATLYAHGIKLIETRPSATNYRGTYLIHAAQKWSKEQAAICLQEPFFSELKKLGFIHKCDGNGFNGYSFSLPMACIIGAVDLNCCFEIINHHDNVMPHYINGNYKCYINKKEEKFGNYENGRYAWIGKNHRVLASTIPYKNNQGYYQEFKGDESQLIFKSDWKESVDYATNK